MAGGNILFVKRDLLGKNSTNSFNDIVQGRVNSALTLKGNHSIEVINVHSFDLESKERRRVFKAIDHAKERAARDPSGKSMLFVTPA